MNNPKEKNIIAMTRMLIPEYLRNFLILLNFQEYFRTSKHLRMNYIKGQERSELRPPRLFLRGLARASQK